MVAEPESGSRKPVIIFIVVDFPAPLGPRNPSTSPRITFSETPSTALMLPKLFLSASVSINAVISSYLSTREWATAGPRRDPTELHLRKKVRCSPPLGVTSVIGADHRQRSGPRRQPAGLGGTLCPAIVRGSRGTSAAGSATPRGSRIRRSFPRH